jgi:hypothetical protein
MANNIVVTHTDGSQDVYPNAMAGISNNTSGSGWKLSAIPTDPSQPAFVISLRSGDTYQNSGPLPTVSAYVASTVLDQNPTTSQGTGTPDTPSDALNILSNVVPAGTTDTVT